MNDLYITPDDVFEYEILKHKFELAPISVQEYMENANLFAKFENLNLNQQDKFRKFIASKIVKVDGKDFDEKQIHVMKPKVFFDVVKKLTEQLNLKEDEKIFHQDQ
jgi:hypothetical protein